MARGTVQEGQPVTRLLQRASFLCLRGRHDDALAVAKEALRSASLRDPDSDSSRTLQARCLTQMGAAQSAAGHGFDAIATLRDALKRDPSAVGALIGLAVVLKGTDPIHVPEALSLLRQAYRLEPGNAEVCATLATLLTDVGVRLKLAGLPASAIEHYNEAIGVLPDYGQAYYNLGVAYADSGNAQMALTCYEKCIALHPLHVEAWCNLGVLHKNAGRLEDALQAYNSALVSNPNFELAKRNLAVALCERGTAIKDGGDGKTAKALYKRALALCPNFADAHYNLGVTYVEEGKAERALVCYSLAVQFNDKLTEAHNNLGVVHKDLGNLEKSLECYKRALQCDDQHHQTHNNIAVVYTLMGNIEQASHHLDMANALSPRYAEAHNNIGVLLRDQGDIDEAIVKYDNCIKLDPRADMACQNRLHALNYSEHWTKAAIFEEHRKWGAAFQARIDAEVASAAANSLEDSLASTVEAWAENPPCPDPEISRGPGTGRPLRVAYISPDFFTHSVSYFAEVLLAKHSPDCVMVFAYSNTAQQDAKTERLKSYPNVEGRWRNIWGLSSVDVAKLIRADKIDILVELAGHTANNRLDVMALRMAPVQITWIGYPNTTGLSSVHYRVTDALVDPEDTTQQFTEKLWRLPGSFLCYTPSVNAPKSVAPPPSELSGGIVTFGSFNVLAKCQARTIKLWAAILKRVPHSRLLLKAKPLGAPAARRRIEKQFEEHGVSSKRLDLVPLIPATHSHLQAYANMDVGLDPFPYAGTTTTCEALYMGVPVITLGVRSKKGDHAHNVGVSLLTSIGHSEFIAYSDQEYVDKAVALGTNLPRLKKIRERLRTDMMNSPLGNAQKYVENVETMFCDMWEQRGGKVGRKLPIPGKETTTNKRSTAELSEEAFQSADVEPKSRRHKSELKKPAANGIPHSPEVVVELGGVVPPVHEVHVEDDRPGKQTEVPSAAPRNKRRHEHPEKEHVSESRRHKSENNIQNDIANETAEAAEVGELEEVIAPLHDVRIDAGAADEQENLANGSPRNKRRHEPSEDKPASEFRRHKSESAFNGKLKAADTDIQHSGNTAHPALPNGVRNVGGSTEDEANSENPDAQNSQGPEPLKDSSSSSATPLQHQRTDNDLKSIMVGAKEGINVCE